MQVSNFSQNISSSPGQLYANADLSYKATISFLMLAMLLLIFSPPASAVLSGEVIARQGNSNGATACMSCHGDKGQGNEAGVYPYLAGQSSHYLVKQLKDFASGRRENPVMKVFASALSDAQINAVAEYYSRLPLITTPNSTNQTALRAEGETLATNGKWSDGVPACFQCHGDKGQGIPPHFPAISGQSSAYIKKQLEHWQKGERKNDHAGLMQAVITPLNEDEMTAVANFLSAQSPVTTK